MKSLILAILLISNTFAAWTPSIAQQKEIHQKVAVELNFKELKKVIRKGLDPNFIFKDLNLASSGVGSLNTTFGHMLSDRLMFDDMTVAERDIVFKMYRYLHKKGADFNMGTPSWAPVLANFVSDSAQFYEISQGESGYQKVRYENAHMLVEYLLVEVGVDVNKTVYYDKGLTALKYSVRKEGHSLFERLLRAGADVHDNGECESYYVLFGGYKHYLQYDKNQLALKTFWPFYPLLREAGLDEEFCVDTHPLIKPAFGDPARIPEHYNTFEPIPDEYEPYDFFDDLF